jgi:RNA polymerase sigma factor (sigma-70 family)
LGRDDDGRVEHFRELHAKQIARVLGYARRQLNDEHLAEDATQESFTRYWREFGHKHRPLPDSPDAYLWRIVEHTVITLGQRSKRDGPPRQPGDDRCSQANDPAGVGVHADPTRSIDAWENVHDLRSDRCWRALATTEKTALYLHHALAMPVAEIAASMGRPVGGVRGLLARGASKYRECVKRRQDGQRSQ